MPPMRKIANDAKSTTTGVRRGRHNHARRGMAQSERGHTRRPSGGESDRQCGDGIGRAHMHQPGALHAQIAAGRDH